MRYFVIQFKQEWDSKKNMLSMAVAGRIGGEYWCPGSPGGAVVQAADGACEMPAGCIPYVAIIHDSLEYKINPSPILKIGLGDVPGCTVNLRSYPLRKKDMFRLPLSARFDAVVGGKAEDFAGCEEAIERSGLRGRKVAVAITESTWVASKVADCLKDAGNDVTVLDDPPLPIVSVLYRSCAHVVHLGHCRKGYLHSLAMYHATVPGRTLTEKYPGLPKFEVATMDELIQFLDG